MTWKSNSLLSWNDVVEEWTNIWDKERRLEMSSDLNDLEMAKKRDHKIMITNEAINKVPRVQYKEISETEYDNLQELARQVLQISKDEKLYLKLKITLDGYYR